MTTKIDVTFRRAIGGRFLIAAIVCGSLTILKVHQDVTRPEPTKPLRLPMVLYDPSAREISP